MRKIFIAIITFYQKYLSRDTGYFPKLFGVSKPTCGFYPTCSEYSKQSFVKHGVLKGLVLTSIRISKCHPFRDPSIDPVPNEFTLSFRKKVR